MFNGEAEATNDLKVRVERYICVACVRVRVHGSYLHVHNVYPDTHITNTQNHTHPSLVRFTL